MTRNNEKAVAAPAGVAEARHHVPVPRRWRPSDAGRLLRSGFHELPKPVKVIVELLVGGGSRQIPKVEPLPHGVLTCYNRYDVLQPDDDDDEEEGAAVEDDDDDGAAAAEDDDGDE